MEVEAAKSPKTYSVPDAASLIGGWSKYSLWRALKRGQVKFVRSAPGRLGQPVLHIPASEVRRLVALQEGRGPRKRTTPLVPP